MKLSNYILIFTEFASRIYVCICI